LYQSYIGRALFEAFKDSKKVLNKLMKARHVRQVSSTWKFAFQASSSTCPHLMGEVIKLWLCQHPISS